MFSRVFILFSYLFALSLAQRPPSDITVECMACVFAVNEVEALLVENRTEADIATYLDTQVCDRLTAPGSKARMACDAAVLFVPTIVKAFESSNRGSVNALCVDDFKACHVPQWPIPDPQPVPHVTVDISLPPRQRWQKVCAMPRLNSMVRLYDFLNSTFKRFDDVLATGNELLTLFPSDYADEIRGCSDAMLGPSRDAGFFGFANLLYELTALCTSIVAQPSSGGGVLHARNLDFWAGLAFEDYVRNATALVTFVNGSSPSSPVVYKMTTFAGYMGALTGERKGIGAVTINTRFMPSIVKVFDEAMAALRKGGVNLVSFLSRDSLAAATSWDDLVARLSNEPILVDVYYTTSGPAKWNGAVISRNPLNATNVWRLSPSEDFLLQTNYDHWKPTPWFDDRRDGGNKHMRALNHNYTPKTLASVLSQKPTLNLQTVYSITASSAANDLTTVRRYCPYPCAQ